jgi:hypothetical protein
MRKGFASDKAQRNTVMQRPRQSGAVRPEHGRRFFICPACPERFGGEQKYKDHWKEKHAGAKDLRKDVHLS